MRRFRSSIEEYKEEEKQTSGRNLLGQKKSNNLQIWGLFKPFDRCIPAFTRNSAVPSIMPMRQQASYSTARYHRLTKQAGGDGFVDLQFQKPPPRIPYKAILLASILFIAGTLLIVIGCLLLTGYIDTKYADRTWPVLILGSLMFIPGSYHVRLAFYAWKGYEGYSYEDIPEFE